MGSLSYCYGENNLIHKSIYINMNYKEKCLICFEEFEISYENEYYKSDCNCKIHPPCFNNYIIEKINSGKVPINCPYCNKKEINETIVKYYLTQFGREDLIEKYDNFNMNYFLIQHKDEASCCPTPGCKYIFIYDKGDDKFSCPLCNNEYCLKCKTKYHKGKTCKEYEKCLSEKEKKNDKLFYKFAIGSKYKQCPYCKFWVEKNEGCNHIACRCGNHFCYNCGEKMQDIMNHICKS